ncbi:MAG: hypothetical protein F4X02_07495 [Chloroflexi bacterium]|nr:hypothetical protein [Chloroflexota bacterium]
MYPYYLLPNAGDTQEPEEERKAEESQSWLPSYIYAYVNPKPTPPPPPPVDPVIEEYNQRQEARIGYKPDEKVTVVQPAGSGGSAEPTAAPRRPSYLNDVEAYGQRAEQRAVAQNSEQDSEDILAEFAGEREFTEADVLKFCEYICEKDETVFTQVMKILEGFEPDADEQTIRQRVNEYLRLLGLNDYFPPEVVYSAPLGATLFQGNTSNATFPDGSEILQSGGRSDQERSYKVPPPELNHPTQEFLRNTFPDSWNPEWTTRAELEAFLKQRLETFIPGFDLLIVPWDKLTVQGLVHYYGSLIDKAIKDNQQTMDRETNIWLTELDTELGLASQLLSRTAKAPLEDETALLEAFGYKDAAQARTD